MTVGTVHSSSGGLPWRRYSLLVQRYGVAVLATGLAALLFIPLRPLVEISLALPLLFAVVATALLGGTGPGLLAVLLAAIAADYWLYPPFDGFAGGGTSGITHQLLFFVSGALLALLGGAVHRARAQIKLEERVLRQRDERYRAFLEQTTEGVWRFELEEPLAVTRADDEQVDHLFQHAYLAECNEAMAQMHRASSAQELIGTRLTAFLSPTDPSSLRLVRAFVQSRYRLLDAESHEHDQSGVERHFLNNVLGIITDGVLHHIWGSQRDITERIHAEMALGRSEERYRALVEAATQVVWTWDLRGRTSNFDKVQQWWEEITGQSAEEQTKDGERGWIEALHPDDRARVSQAWNAMLAGAHFDIEYRVRTRDGSYRYIWVRAVPVHDPTGEVREFVGMLIDTTTQHQAEEALRASETRLRRVLESDMIGIAFWSEGRVTEANEAFLRLLGYDRTDVAAGLLRQEQLTPSEYVPADTRAQAELAERGSCTPYEKEMFRNDGSQLPVLVGGARLGDDDTDIVSFILDLSERRRAETQLHAAQRLETAGRLAGGIAHETNNQMSIVLGAAHFLLERDDLVPEVREDVEQIRKAAEHTGTITRQLLAFSRQQVLHPQPLDLNAEIRQLEPVIRRCVGERIALVLRLAPKVGLVRADPGQLSQVLINLVLNARDAIVDQGTLTIDTGHTTIGKDSLRAARAEPIPPGSYTALTVSDTGCGIDQPTMHRIFEPFFTTKPLGEGTGLGLSTVHGIVRQSNGHIAVESAPGSGTTFRVFLPVIAADEQPPVPAPGLSASGLTGTVLLVDDEPGIRTPFARALQAAGHTVVEASTAEEALAVVTNNGEIDLVVTDVIMPGMGGGQLARHLAQLYPTLPVLITSGYADEEMRRRGLMDTGQPFLQKPYSPAVLVAQVGEMLERARQGP